MKTIVFDTFLKRNNLYPLLVTGLAAAYLLIAITPMIADFNKGNQQTSQMPNAELVGNPTAVTDRTPPDFLKMSEWHLFGQNMSPESSNSSTPPTQLQLKLLGIFHLSKNGAADHAIIETADQIQKTYRINDALPDGAVLQAIEKDKVILLVDNRRELLAFQKHMPESQPAVEDPSLTQ